MKLNFNQLGNHLEKSLQPVYFISGDEPFQLDESVSMIREAAKAQGFTEREVYHVDRSFDWDQLTYSADSMSLFATRKIIELRIPGAKPGDKGSKALVAYTSQLPEDTLLLIVSGKLDSSQTRSKWFKAIDGVGATLAVWPLEIQQLPGWLKQRMQLRGLQPTEDALTILAEQVEGNLLAADQELEKLRMLYGECEITAEMVVDAVSDSARFDAFALVDVALQGDPVRVSRILHGLKNEGEDVLHILGALMYQLRMLEKMSQAVANGQQLEQVFSQYRIWDKRKIVLSAGLKRHGLKRWQAFLLVAGRIERMCKGLATGKPWDELLQLVLRIAGTALFPLTAEQIATN
ncbi:MAG: DNA polymerase III subunit delta [Gammaproteobacteria bacterium]|nr:DNA polymerase III subunit delta [Gammaproteobacteria bacterium]